MKTFAAVTMGALLLLSCREDRSPKSLPGGLPAERAVRQVELQPGEPRGAVAVRNPYAANQNALAEGERLYHWYNCSGCHFAGGGGIGPPLMDDEWIYGSEPQNILDSILEGRPDGMPSYHGKLPLDHAWKIVAYVQTLGGVPEGRQPGDVGREQMGDPGSEGKPLPEAVKDGSDERDSGGERPEGSG